MICCYSLSLSLTTNKTTHTHTTQHKTKNKRTHTHTRNRKKEKLYFLKVEGGGGAKGWMGCKWSRGGGSDKLTDQSIEVGLASQVYHIGFTGFGKGKMAAEVGGGGGGGGVWPYNSG